VVVAFVAGDGCTGVTGGGAAGGFLGGELLGCGGLLLGV